MVKANTIYNSHVLEGLKKLPAESVDMVLTSPPYWSLRDYGKSTDVIWGGNPKCKHKFGKKLTIKKTGGISKTARVGNQRKGVAYFTHNSQFCCKCGAWKGQLGLEPTIDLFVDHLAEIFDEVQRVLKKTGTCWVNLGDTYYTKSGNSYQKDDTSSKKHIKATGLDKTHQLRGNSELAPKSLSLIPFRFAIAMANRGWILRNTIIWHKPNSMPASVKDRFTVDFEYLFFFSKSKKYYFEKQLEPLQKSTFVRSLYPHNSHSQSPYKKQCDGEDMRKFINSQGRNKRCVWNISLKPFKGAHFAVFPDTLCEIPIKAGCPKKVCKKCGIPKVDNYKGRYISKKNSKKNMGCKCNAGYQAGIILDPFMGSGTTAVVAKKLGRDYLGLELNPEYIKIAKRRLKKQDK